jgi:25S rRNA (uracil2634-N3)-methyltransferase
MGKSKAKSSLKATLQSQQSRLKGKQKLAQAAHAAKQSGRKLSHPKSKARVPLLQKVTMPFRPTDQILLIGEGNFSFARALICNPPPELEFLPARNVTATAYDTEDECYTKYPDARAIVSYLKKMGVEVLFGVDATKLEKVPALKGRRWNRIVWNFPHAGEKFTFKHLQNTLLKFFVQGRVLRTRIEIYSQINW